MSKGIDYGLDLDTSGFTGGVGEARSSLGGFQAFSVGSMAAIGAAVAGAALAVKGIGMAFREAKAAVAEAANRETMQTAFIPLLGSAKAAKERMAELADFAAHTPFQLPEVAAASRTLETLTDGALSTGQGLTMVGDVASGTNTPFEELAVTIGRLYSGLDSGRPVGEAMQRLQEIGAITPGVRTKLEKLQAEGKKGSEVWQVAAEDLARFSGGMELQSQTWNGKLSTLSDAWAEVRAQFGEPIMDALKPLLDDGIGTIESMASKAREIGETIAYAMRFMVESFKQGEAWNLAKLGLTLAFQEAVNFLYAGLMGIWKSLPSVIVEAFKTGIEVFNILTEASFWKLVGDMFAGVMRTTMLGIMAMVADFAANMMDMVPGMGKQTEIMRDLAEIMKGGVAPSLAESGTAGAELINTYGTRVLDRFQDGFGNISAAFRDGFSDAAELMDTSGVRAEMAAVSDKIVAALDQQDAAQKAKEDEDAAKGKPKRQKTDDDTPRIKVNWETVLAGSLAKVGGGGYGRMMLSAENIPAKQLSEQRKTNELLNKLLQKQGNALAVLG